MSSYRRDDKQFRAQIQRLADSGLKLDQSELIVRLRGNTKTTMERAGYKFRPAPVTPQRHKLAEFVSGLVCWAPIIVIALAAIAGLLHVLRGVL